MHDCQYDRKYFQKRYSNLNIEVLYKWYKGILSKALKLVGKTIDEFKRGKALDIGCGYGYAMDVFKELGFDEVYGLDVSEHAIDVCRERGHNAFLHDITSRPFDLIESKFVLITAFEVLEHIPYAKLLDTIRNIHAVLENGGVFIATTPSRRSLINKGKHDPTHVTLGDTKLWYNLMKHVDWRELFVIPIHWIPILWRLTSHHIFLRVPEIFSTSLLICGEK